MDLTQLRQEFEDAPEQRMLSDSTFDRLHKLGNDGLLRLAPDVRAKYFATAKYHAGQRQAIDGIEGMVIGDQTAEEVLRSLPTEQSS